MKRGPDKQFDRDEVLERAMHLFWRQGYEATGMAELLAHMGIGRQSLYDTFGDKKSLFLAALDRYIQAYIMPMTAALRAPGSPLGNVRRFLELSAAMIAAGDHCGCLLGNTVAEMARTDPDVAARLGSLFSTGEATLATTIAQARAAGEVRSPLPDEDLARMVIVAGQGLALLTKLDAHRGWAESTIQSILKVLEGYPR